MKPKIEALTVEEKSALRNEFAKAAGEEATRGGK